MCNLSPDILILTHAHDDHYNCAFTLWLMERFPSLVVAAPESVQKDLRAASSYPLDTRLVPYGTLKDRQESFSFRNMSVTLYRTKHSGAETFQTEHYTALIRGSKSVLYLGDALAETAVFDWMDFFGDVNILVAPFYFLTLIKGQKIIKQLFQPDCSAFLHLPNPESEGAQYNPFIRKSEVAFRKAGNQMMLFETPGQTLSF